MDPAVVEHLRPFIVASWHGHRDDPEIPAAVREVWREKFRAGPRSREQSNVDLAVLDPKGRVVHAFDGFPKRMPGPARKPGRQETLPEYTLRELKSAASRLDPIESPAKERPLTLPDLEGSGGVRVFVRLLDDRMKAYQAPIVEVVPLEDDDWKPLAYPEEERSIDAAVLEKWLSQVYPPGIMERTNPRTKKVYGIRAVEGTLSLAPAGADGDLRYAVLRGDVRLTDEGSDGFSYEGELEIVLGYRASGSRVHSLRGVFDGIYPRSDPVQGRVRELPLRAAFESRPEAGLD